MWQWEEIKAINPPTKGQSRSILQFLLEIGATTPNLLSDSLDILDKYEEPHIIAFSLLPYVLKTDKSPFSVNSLGENVPPIKLSFHTVSLCLETDGTIKQTTDNSKNSLLQTNAITNTTLVMAFVPLWGERLKIYEEYQACVNSNGLNNKNIGKREHWMALPLEANTGPLSAKAFENELTVRVRSEVVYVVNKFIRAYEITQMIELPAKTFLYSYFTLFDTGRISAGGIPLPIFFSLNSLIPTFGNSKLNRNKLMRSLETHLNYRDRIVKQLLAMSSLIKDGEPELAIVGSVSAIEWYINEKFPKFIRKGKNDKEFKTSLSQCLKDNAMTDIFDEKTRNHLYTLAQARNSIVHGEPPSRETYSTTNIGKYAVSSIELCFKVYRNINLHLLSD